MGRHSSVEWVLTEKDFDKVWDYLVYFFEFGSLDLDASIPRMSTNLFSVKGFASQVVAQVG